MMYYIISKSDEELFHYGIPRRSGRYPYGSGERPFQSVSRKAYNQALRSDRRGFGRSEEFTKDRIIKKGTTMYRAMKTPDEKSSDGVTSVTYLEPDRNMYRRGVREWDDRKRDFTGKREQVYEKTMELTDDLKIASRKRVKDTLASIIKERPDLSTKAMEEYAKEHRWDGKTGQKITVEQAKAYAKEHGTKDLDSTEKGWENTGQTVFSDYLVAFNKSPTLRKELSERLKKEGFNAMVDEDSNGMYSNPHGIDQLFVFDADKILKTTGVMKLTPDEQAKAVDEYQKWFYDAFRNKKQSHNTWNLLVHGYYISPNTDHLSHSGVSKKNGAPGRGSGRYALGSGARPYQREKRLGFFARRKQEKQRVAILAQKKKELAEAKRVAEENAKLKQQIIDRPTATLVDKFAAEMTNDEIQQALNRIRLLNDVSKLKASETPKEKSAFESFDNFMTQVGKVNKWGDTAINSYNNVAAVVNMLDKASKEAKKSKDDRSFKMATINKGGGK